ncbi:hypothetical protein PISMIDRAFT_431274 [Pisolithus microcarpus 441]|uniref:Uncharacterized protein n=1 Tax=Pisolithus microcarpus 441 TaxID=765257 RepID=A0A0C9ZW07_9AGAM|nr:hypothetical protein PISMIDRAFT_431274 [Pisolithus microcarpus 441]
MDQTVSERSACSSRRNRVRFSGTHIAASARPIHALGKVPRHTQMWRHREHRMLLFIRVCNDMSAFSPSWQLDAGEVALGTHGIKLPT